jgi:mannose-1-phosphate guanylyltransferase/mannose-6-phosphate isomerase-like protein (cupin superfamily)
MLTVVVLCGGIGKRLWPISTVDIPKQFTRLSCELSLFQKTLLRLKKLQDVCQVKIVISTHVRYIDMVSKQAADLLIDDYDIIAEPEQRGTFASVACCASYLLQAKYSKILFLPSDHLVEDSEFCSSIVASLAMNIGNKIMLYGGKASDFNSQFGYIKPDKELSPNLYDVQLFIEKPATCDLVSESLVNYGIFMGNTIAFLRLIQSAAPDDFADIEAVKYSKKDNMVLCSDAFLHIKNISFDMHVLQQIPDHLLVYRTTFSWQDCGSFAGMCYDDLPQFWCKWGYYQIIYQTTTFIIKKLVFKPLQATSLQFHQHRMESFMLHSGDGQIYIDNVVYNITPTCTLQDNNTIHIYPLQRHKIFNTSSTMPLILFELQTGDIISEDDIVRLPEDGIIV